MSNLNKKSRCKKCLKKNTIMEFKCKCNNIYCSIHRYPEEHDCSYDYKQNEKRKIVEENKKIKRFKIDKI